MEVEEQLRSHGAVSDGGGIIGINHSITIDILIFDVAGNNSREFLRRACCNISGILEESKRLHAIYLANTVSCLDEVAVKTRLFKHCHDLIAVVVKIAADREIHPADPLVEVKSEFGAPAVHNACILERSSHTDHGGIFTGSTHPDIGAALIICVSSDCKAAEQTCIDSDIVLVCLFMAWILSSNLAKIGTAEIGIETAAERVDTAGHIILLGVICPGIFRQIVSIENAS